MLVYPLHYNSVVVWKTAAQCFLAWRLNRFANQHVNNEREYFFSSFCCCFGQVSTVIFGLLSAPVYKPHPLFFLKILILSTYKPHWFISRTYDTHEQSIQHTPKPQQKWRTIEITQTRSLAKQIGILFTCFWIIIMIREYSVCFILHSAWRWVHISETSLN